MQPRSGTDRQNAGASERRLPERLTSVLGRDSVIGTVCALIDEAPLVTIVGPGGIGKSTLALATALQRDEARHGGGRFLDLAYCQVGNDVVPYVHGALDIPATRVSDARSIADHLAGRTALLILDNCEHVIDAVAQLADEIALRANGVRLLATSREALRIPGERVIRLSGLENAPMDEGLNALEAGAYPAIALLVERASDANRDFRLHDRDVAAAIDICRRLDGIPLAIELAAARLDTMSVTELAARLHEGFSLLTDGLRTAMPRHRTLEAMLDWSYAMLSEAERTVIASLSVFRGAFSLNAALSVAREPGQTTAHVTRCVGDLVAKSLISVQPDPGGRRYRLLETTRSYMARRLAARRDANVIRRRHATVCLDLLEGARDDLLLLRRDVWVDRYGALVADVQVSIEWAFSPDGEWPLGAALVGSATPLAEQLVLPTTFFKRLEQVVDRGTTGPEAWTPDIARLGLPLMHARIHLTGDLSFGRKITERTAGPSGSRLPEVVAGEFGAALAMGDYPDAIRLADEICVIGRQSGDVALQTLGDRCSAQANLYLGHFAVAADLAQRVIDSPFQHLPHSVNSHRISMRVVLSVCTAMTGDTAGALDVAAEGVALGRRDNPLSLCLMLILGAVPAALWAGQERQARDWLDEALDVSRTNGASFWHHSAEALAAALAEPGADGIRPFPDIEIAKRVGHTVFDMLPTFSPDLLCRQMEQRVEEGSVRWNAAEIARIKALRDAGTSPEAALADLDEAAAIAHRQGGGLWLERIEASRELIMDTYAIRMHSRLR